MSEFAASDAGSRPPDGGRRSGTVLEITWHRWRYPGDNRGPAVEIDPVSPNPNQKETSMTRRIPLTFLAAAAVIPLTALAVGCGSSGGGATASTPPKTASGQAATVGVANSGLGNVLVDSQGRTLYLFKKDTGTTSTCTGA